MKITLKTLPEATAQEVFDHVARHLLTQKKKSLGVSEDSKDTCCYRGEGGCKCAAGCLIADDEYDPDMEGKNWEGLITLGWVPKDHSQLIVNLQEVHDLNKVNEWKDELFIVAELFDLNDKEVRRHV